MTKQNSELEPSYDRVAEDYAAEFFDELQRKPFDRQVLDQFAETVGLRGEVCELGCGPGQVARYLMDRGLSMRGRDLSEAMIKCARRLNPDIDFKRGDMLALDLPDASLDAIVCFYAIIHLPRRSVSRALAEMNRVLRFNGRLLISFHGGEGELHRDQWYDRPVSIDVNLFQTDEMSSYFASAGFEIESIAEREPYDFEYPTRRVYLSGRKIASSKLPME